MKNKTKTYILLVLMLSIWGVLSFKIFSVIEPEPQQKRLEEDIVKFTPKSLMTADTFSIKKLERDPFLGEFRIKKKIEHSKKPIQIKPKFVWPEVVYHGCIAKSGQTKQVFIISIDQVQYFISLHDEVKSIRLDSATKDFIVISYQGYSKKVERG